MRGIGWGGAGQGWAGMGDLSFLVGPSGESEKVGYNGLDVTMDNQQEVHLTV